MSSNECEERDVVVACEGPKKKQKIGSNKSDDEVTTGIVLPVAVFDASFTETSIPNTGEQYLALVQLERKRLPGIVVAEGIQEQSLSIDELLPPSDLTPLIVKKVRVDIIMESFEVERQDVKIQEAKVPNLPSDADRHAWLKYFYGIDHSKPVKPVKQPDFDKIMSSISREMAMQLLSFHNAWLEEISPGLIDFDVIYKLLVMIDDTPTPSQTDKLRSLARHCIKLLKLEAIPKVAEKMEEIVVLVARWFGQRDLVRVVLK